MMLVRTQWRTLTHVFVCFAHETRAFANKTSDPEAKHILLEIADEFESLATFSATRVPKAPKPWNC
jgi:hypothetical protein